MPHMGTGMSTHQLQPSSMGQSSDSSPYAVPFRSTEPFSIEAWTSVVQPMLASNVMTTATQMYTTTPSLASTGYRTGYTPAQGYTEQMAISMGQTTQRSYSYCATYVVVSCPRTMYCPQCTPMDGAVAADDTCRQLTLWPAPGEVDICKSVNDSASCYFDPTGGGNIDSLLPTSRPKAPARLEYVQVCNEGIIDISQKQGLTGTSPTPIWAQTHSIVWPPGTIAVLPIGGNATIRGDAPDYAWRVNRAHVVTFEVTLPPSTIHFSSKQSKDGSARTLTCEMIDLTHDIRYKGVFVLLDDASCVKSRSCIPDTGTVVDRHSPAMDRIL